MHRSGIFGGIVAPAQPQLIMIMPAIYKQPYSWLLYHQEPDIYLEHRSWHTTYSTVGIIITYTLDIAIPYRH